MMKTVETETEGLKRAYTLTIPAKDIEARVEQEIKRIAPQVRMQGFRPGKVPPNLIRKMHGERLRQDALSGVVQDSVQKLLADNKLRPAMQPEVELDEQYQPGKDAEVRVRLETLPDLPEPNIGSLALERWTVEPDDSALDEQLQQLASSRKNWLDAEEGRAAAAGDQVVIDYSGKVGGEPFDGGTGENMAVELDSGQLIPGFEDQLVGARVGEQRTLAVTFPDDYPAANLKGKQATFDVTVRQVKVAGETQVDDEFAKSLGLTGLDQLRQLLRDQQQQELNGLTRTHMKRKLLDELAARHDFAVPQTMVDAEYANIMRQLEHEASHEADPESARKELEAEAGEYRSIAERRVRLGLLLSEIGRANGVEVSQQEMQRLVAQAAQQYQPKDRERFVQYIQQDPMAAAQLRAPLYEDKVVDFLFGTATITDRPASRAELEADLESEVGHVHGPGCGHDHHEHEPAVAAKPKRSSAKKAKAADGTEPAPAEAAAAAEAVKPAATKAASAAKSKAAKPAKPAKGAVEPEPAAPEPAEPVKDGAGGKPEEPQAAVKAAKAARKTPAKKAAKAGE